MKRFFLLAVSAVLAVTACSQKGKDSGELPMQSTKFTHIDVEKLGKNVDLNMDLTKLTLPELRILENVFAAQKGYLFDESEIRSVYMQTKWYQKKMSDFEDNMEWDDDGNLVMPSLNYTPEQTKFIEKVKAREKELLADNFKVGEGQKVNTSNIVNIYQLDQFGGPLQKGLATNGFVIAQDNYDQLFQIYENNDYHDFPSFVTTDLYLQAFHIYFDTLLKLAEEKVLSGRILEFSEKMKQIFIDESKNNANPQIRELAKWNSAYFAVAVALMTDKPLSGVDPALQGLAQEEIGKVKKAENDFSQFLGSTNVMFPYSLFRPRGHYTRSDNLKRYFMAMMWIQTVPFGTDVPVQLQRAALLSETIKNKGMLDEYKQLTDPITYLMGEPDNVSILQVSDIMSQNGVSLADMIADDAKHNIIKAKVEELSRKQTRIKPKFLRSSECKINLMPQRYFPDAEVLQELVDVENKVSKRPVSKGLDYFAALGNQTAENILLNEYNEAKNWDQYTTYFNNMKNRMKEIDWSATLSNKWIQALTLLSHTDDNSPYFMIGDPWQRKSLNAMLASWAELKHDAILYGKQPMMAECGGGIPEPYVKGYVEPNVKFWTRAIELVKETQEAFKVYKIDEENITEVTESLLEYGETLLTISEKELKGEKLTQQEYNEIELIGSNFEYLTLQMLNAGTDTGIMDWNSVEGADKKVALVADVLTSNGDNNPNPSILYEAIGPAYEMYVVVEIGGMLYLTRGAVFSYREFQRDVTAPRLTDEEWQKDLESMPNEGAPEWMNGIVIPKEGVPQDNERTFYSSGC